jgi:cell division protein FtsB
MRNFQKSRGWKSIIRSKPVLIFLTILALFFSFGVIGFMAKLHTVVENRKIAENKLAELELEKEKLSSSIAKLETNEGVEESIRTKFGLAKEGEGLIMIVEDKNTPEPTPKKSEGPLSFLFFWRNWFK